MASIIAPAIWNERCSYKSTNPKPEEFRRGPIFRLLIYFLFLMYLMFKIVSFGITCNSSNLGWDISSQGYKSKTWRVFLSPSMIIVIALSVIGTVHSMWSSCSWLHLSTRILICSSGSLKKRAPRFIFLSYWVRFWTKKKDSFTEIFKSSR